MDSASLVMQFMGPALQAAGTGMQVSSHLRRGEIAEQMGEYEAQQYKAAGGQAFASAQRDMLEERKKGERVLSEARAKGAASGAGGVGLDAIFRGIEEESAYHQAAARYKGEVAQWEAGNKAEAARYKAKITKGESMLDAIGAGIKGTYGVMKSMDWGTGSTSSEDYDPYSGWRTKTTRYR